MAGRAALGGQKRLFRNKERDHREKRTVVGVKSAERAYRERGFGERSEEGGIWVRGSRRESGRRVRLVVVVVVVVSGKVSGSRQAGKQWQWQRVVVVVVVKVRW